MQKSGKFVVLTLSLNLVTLRESKEGGEQVWVVVVGHYGKRFGRRRLWLEEEKIAG